MHLINYDTFKTFLQAEADPKLAEMIIEVVSGRIEHALNRFLVEQYRSTKFNVETGKAILSLPAFPINSAVYSVTVDNAGITMTEGTDFYINESNGVIHFTQSLYRYNPLQMTVGWVGGYTTTLETGAVGTTITVVTGAPVDLIHACTLQSIFQYRKRDSLGTTSITTPDGSITTSITVPNLLPEVKAILKSYRRSPM